MSKLREEARGRPCTMRLSDNCTGGGEDTVLAHCPSEDKCMGRKSQDWWSCWACYHCHLSADSVGTKYSSAEINEAWLRGIHETLKTLVNEGIIDVPRDANKTYNRQMGK